MQVTISQAIPIITDAIKAKLVAMLVGSPGIGKSQVVYAIAKEYNLFVIDLRLSQCDPTDLMGFPHIIGTRAGYAPMNTFPIEGDEIPAGYSGWLLFMDEFNSAVPAVQAAAYKIVLDKMVGIYHLHKNVAIVCAGNLESDNAIVQPMSTALQSRLLHLELIVDTKELIDHANDKHWDPRITSFLEFKPGNAYTFTPDHTDKTYACPRTWEFADRILKTVAPGAKHLLAMLAGTVSEGIAREFMGFCKVHADLPKIAKIITDPLGQRVPDEPSIRYALAGSISHNADMDNLGALVKYVKRMPMEFQVFALKGAVRRNNKLMAHPAIQEWCNETTIAFF